MMPEAETLLNAEPPSVYNFSNWNDFYRRALRYHNATRPNDQRVIDRIETFRKFMSPRVLGYLEGFVLPHPRYDTTEGWDTWVTNVMESLRIYDSSIGRARTVDGWVAQFKTGKATEREFWQGLDRLVSLDEISSIEQRNIFWDTHSWEAQQRLVERCPYFDPTNEVWTSEEPGLATNAEQKLSQIMEFSVVDEQIQQIMQKLKRKGLICASSIVICVLLCVIAFNIRDTAYIVGYILILVAIPLWAVAITLPIFLILSWRNLRQKRKRQQEIRLQETT